MTTRKYNPDIHHRRSIRLSGYDYSMEGLYFITICCKDKEAKFGKIEHGEMILNDTGIIAHDEWTKLPQRFTNLQLDIFQIMPNHIHAIIVLHNVGAGLAPAQNSGQIQAGTTNQSGSNNTKAATVGDIVGAYKSLVTKHCLDNLKHYHAKVELMPFIGKIWQRNYYEHIIKNEQSFQTISAYIMNNPANWANDKFYR